MSLRPLDFISGANSPFKRELGAADGRPSRMMQFYIAYRLASSREYILLGYDYFTRGRSHHAVKGRLLPLGPPRLCAILCPDILHVALPDRSIAGGRYGGPPFSYPRQREVRR